jgi:uncharacterized membrane protein
MKQLLSLKSIFLGVGLSLATIPLGLSAVSAPATADVAQKSLGGRTTLAATNVEEFIIRGNEPFWRVTVSKDGIFYETPEIKKQRLSPYVAPLKAEGRPLDVVRVYRLQRRPNSMLIINKVDSCSDTMSDKSYPYTATLIMGNTVMTGCAERP